MCWKNELWEGRKKDGKIPKVKLQILKGAGLDWGDLAALNPTRVDVFPSQGKCSGEFISF